MSKLRFSQENYPTIADFVADSFEKYMADFTPKYKTMDAAYLTEFRKTNTEVKALDSRAARRAKQKSVTEQLYAKADSVAFNVELLSHYASRVGLDASIAQAAYKPLISRNIEGGVTALREAVPYYTEHAEKMTDMTEEFLPQMVKDIAELDALNAEQNKLMNANKMGTSVALALYVKLDKYIEEVCQAGRLIFKGKPQRDEFLYNKLMARVRAANEGKKAAAEEEETTPKP